MANLGYMQVVRHCNQYCRFCSNPETPYILDLDTARRQIDDFAARDYFGVILTGGEPSLCDHIPEIVAYAHERGLHTRMITNGQRLSRRALAESYVGAGLRHYHVSIHSCRPAIEDFLTGTENSHERAMAALTHLGELGATVNINTVINRYNADHLDETIAFFIRRFPFIRHFVWNNLDPSMGRADTNRDTAPRLGDFEVSLHRAMRLLHDSGRSFRVERVPLCYMAEFAWASTETRKIVKGEERMVHFLDEKGTVRQTDFRHLKAEVCKSCSYDSICGGLFELGEHYDPGELAPVFLPPEPVIRKILDEPEISIQADAPLASQRLLLVLTHACNLRCRYCHEIKDESRMALQTAMRALDVYAAARPVAPAIKLFGGEPTLNREVLEAVIRAARARLPGVRFELTTNATMLDDALVELLLARDDLELHVSLDGAPAHHDHNRTVHLRLHQAPPTASPPVGQSPTGPPHGAGSVHAAATRHAARLAAAGAIVNLTIAPWSAATLPDDLAHLCGLGFRRYNFLPAYYMAWTDAQLAALVASFAQLETRIAASWKSAAPIELTNLDVQAMYTFFNDGLVVDVDGDVFQTNLFLWRPFDGLRARLRRGHIGDEPASWRAHPPADDVHGWIAETASATTLAATAAVDGALSSLCRNLLERRARLRSRPARRPARGARPAT